MKEKHGVVVIRCLVLVLGRVSAQLFKTAFAPLNRRVKVNGRADDVPKDGCAPGSQERRSSIEWSEARDRSVGIESEETSKRRTDLSRCTTGGLRSAWPITSVSDGPAGSAFDSSPPRQAVNSWSPMRIEARRGPSSLADSSSERSSRRGRISGARSRPQWYRSICRSTSRSSCTRPGGSMPRRPATRPTSSRHRITLRGWLCKTAIKEKQNARVT